MTDMSITDVYLYTYNLVLANVSSQNVMLNLSDACKLLNVIRTQPQVLRIGYSSMEGLIWHQVTQGLWWSTMHMYLYTSSVFFFLRLNLSKLVQMVSQRDGCVPVPTIEKSSKVDRVTQRRHGASLLIVSLVFYGAKIEDKEGPLFK